MYWIFISVILAETVDWWYRRYSYH